MAQNQNGHLTTEQLSAFLDKQLSAQEAAETETHLHSCQQCQGVLNDLRQTVALLHVLPQLTLPRSFVLSPEMLTSAMQEPAIPVTIQIEERRRERQQRQQSQRPFERSQARRSVLPRTLRVMSTLVALLGFIFLVSAIPFPTGGTGSSTSGGTSHSTNHPTFVPSSSPSVKPHNSTGTKPQATQKRPSTGSRVSSRNTTQGADPFAPGTRVGRAIDGLLLLVLALLGWLLAIRWRVKQT